MSHVHKWGALPKQKRKFADRRYRCLDADCYATHKAPYLLGKSSICTECGRKFELTRENLLSVNPKCLYCADTTAGRTFRESIAQEAVNLEAEIFAGFEVDPDNQVRLEEETLLYEG